MTILSTFFVSVLFLVRTLHAKVYFGNKQIQKKKHDLERKLEQVGAQVSIGRSCASTNTRRKILNSLDPSSSTFCTLSGSHFYMYWEYHCDDKWFLYVERHSDVYTTFAPVSINLLTYSLSSLKRYFSSDAYVCLRNIDHFTVIWL